MPLEKIKKTLTQEVHDLIQAGTQKGHEDVIVGVIKAQGNKGPRYLLRGYENQHFLRMNSNGYLGMSLRKEIIEAEEHGTRQYGAGPGAVRFISGTFEPHVQLEKKLAAFHNREAAMIFSSAYTTTLGVLTSLIHSKTALISDALNHNCIINAIRLSRPAYKAIYKHLDLDDLKKKLEEASQQGHVRAIVVTDGIFSMRGDHAPLDKIMDIVRSFDHAFEEGVICVVDDSHGVGAFGTTGRGTEEYTHAKVDVLIGTLGKAFGVNGGYVVSDRAVIDYLREKAPLYIYSNPITAGEATAALKAIDILDSHEGIELLNHLRAMTKHFERGLIALGYETIPGEHPVVPLMVRDTDRTTRLVQYLKTHGILVTGLNYPVVPKGDESIRFQISAEHTEADIDFALQILKDFSQGS